ncbi:MAG: glycosyltransferase family 4 protein, partial [Candidatus Aminicenantes bacterium]|nr:glycosyltransferase family 4 protein [Candidatus Aminicenantes bacterium]
MLIHIVTDRFAVGGGAEHIYQVVKGLKDFRFGIFAQPGNAGQKFAALDHVATYTGGYHPRYVLAGQPDLVHIHHLRPLCSFFKTPFSRYKIPIIFTAHGLHIHKYEFSYPKSKSLDIFREGDRTNDPAGARDKTWRSSRSIPPANRWKYFLRFLLEKTVLQKPDMVIAVSREDREFLEQKYHLTNVRYLTNGIDFASVRETAAPGKKELRKELNLPADHFIFTTVARFDFQKGYDILIKAIYLVKDLLNQKAGKIRFLFAGNGPEFAKMNALSRELDVSRYISFLGERADVYKIIKAGDVFLLPSRWEGLPIVLLETGVLRIPALASSTYGNREILTGEKGILFQNEDSRDLAAKIRDIITGKYDLNRYAGDLYREIETDYNLGKMISGLNEIYRSFKKSI